MATEKRLYDSGEGRWADLAPEILAVIFVLIPADEMLRTVPLVCSAWREAAVGPYCWADIDIESWCRRVNNVEIINPVVRKLVRRSRSSCRRVAAYRIGDSCFPAVASAISHKIKVESIQKAQLVPFLVAAQTSGKFLRILQIPMSEISDGMVEKHAPSLAALTVLDISYCLKITFKGIEALGKHCKLLVQLRRNMPPPEFDYSQQGGLKVKVEEEEAISVANTMPRLEHLEFAYGQFTDHGLNAILTKCRALHLLNIRGCMNVQLEGNTEHMCGIISDFRGPWEDELELGHENAGVMSDEDDDEGMSDEDDGCLVDVDTSDDESEYD